MTTYLSPGVYVEEIPSGSAPIIGVGTSTAGFVGLVPNSVNVRVPNPSFEPGPVSASNTVDGLAGKKLAEKLTLSQLQQEIAAGQIDDKSAKLLKASTPGPLTIAATLNVDEISSTELTGKIVNEPLTFDDKADDLEPGDAIPTGYMGRIRGVLGDRKDLKIQVELDVASTDLATIAAATLVNPVTVDAIHVSYDEGTEIDAEIAQKITLLSDKTAILVASEAPEFFEEPRSIPTAVEEVKLCTNFGEFKQFFGDFSLDSGQSALAHAVYGFFRNGGTRCYVMRVDNAGDIANALAEQFDAIDEIALVAAPGIPGAAQTIAEHCKNMGDRFAILDGPETVTDLGTLQPGQAGLPAKSDYAALYFPWLKVYDPATQAEKTVPPCGHMAGIYARVDTQRGVHKAPANEAVLGATGLAYAISKAKQGGLNPHGVNCIRSLNGSITVWGARTWGGKKNTEFMYINVRRLFNYLQESIDEGTQWTVFEPNSPELWAAIRRNVSAFLTTVWRSGALFGATPDQAFYVKCDAETNPPALRDQGQVVTEIGVAVVKPAEFVIFRISQWSGDEG